MEINWTPKAIESFNQVIEYLEEIRTQKEVDKFIEKTKEQIKKIKKGKLKFRKLREPNVYEVLVTKQNLMIFQVDTTRATILLFFDTRQNPEKKIWKDK